MKLQRARVTPVVRAYPDHFTHDVQIELGSLRFEMTADEAHALADALVDAAEKGGPADAA
ncbi:hypothetical protein CEY15_02310 [Dietzia natronolimnaea]|uniref:Uncharacterized protein n=1 Tax=Dietzia natronolimnaea TaxID=161920 RepID=A0A2A2WTU0_9ACTN|nr:hypothetical protein [Dietzia natronolimnaea]PAY24649.1 hypothetical protein CEY15_02310 [Dietzia natronolimnaea]